MADLTENLRLLADENRLRLLHLLNGEALTVAELQEVLELSQSSVSGHLGKLKRAGYLHDHAEGSAHRYRLREDLRDEAAACWNSLRPLTSELDAVADDKRKLQHIRDARGSSWVDRVAGHLHREYAPGRSWDALGHCFLRAAQLGICVDIGAGDGAMIELLLPSCEQLICVDPNEAMIRAGEERIAHAQLAAVRYEKSEGEALPLADHSADTVLFLQSLQYIAHPQQAISEAQRILRPGGRLFILTLSAHNYDEAARFGHAHQGFSKQQLTTWCDGFTNVHCHALNPEPRPPRFVPLLCTADVVHEHGDLA